MNEIRYWIQYIPSNEDVKTSTMVRYKGQIYSHLPELCKKDPEVYTYIWTLGEIRGYHEKWEDLTPVVLGICSNNLKPGNTVYKTNTELVHGTHSWSFQGQYYYEEHDHYSKIEDSYVILGPLTKGDHWTRINSELTADQIKWISVCGPTIVRKNDERYYI